MWSVTASLPQMPELFTSSCEVLVSTGFCIRLHQILPSRAGLTGLIFWEAKKKKKKTLLKTSALCSFHGVTGNKLLTKPQGCRQRWKQNTLHPGPHPQPPACGHSLLLVRKIIKRHKLLEERLTLPGNSQKQPRASSQSEKLLEQFGCDNNYFTVTIHRLGCWRIYLLMLGNFFFFLSGGKRQGKTQRQILTLLEFRRHESGFLRPGQ